MKDASPDGFERSAVSVTVLPSALSCALTVCKTTQGSTSNHMASAAVASAALLEPIALRGHRPMRPPASGSYSTGNLSVSIRFGRTVIGRSRSTVYFFVMAQS
eukprot:scaffold8113_cov67-Phaeocystis_antarctica.AAC.1